MANLKTKFAVANHGDIQSLINQGLLSYPTYVFCRDKNTIVFIDKNQQIQNINGFNQSSIVLVSKFSSFSNRFACVLYFSPSPSKIES